MAGSREDFIMVIDRHQWIGAFKGAPKTQVMTAESSFSSKSSRSHGLGLQIVKALAEGDLKGSFELNSRDKGVSAVVTFPKQSQGGR